MYGKATETAIAAMSRLAEVYDKNEVLLSAEQIANARGLPKPFVAKVMSTMAQAGLVVAVRGPGGGFRFAKPPREVYLYDVFCLLEEKDAADICPFGGGVCGDLDKCPLHDRLTKVHKAVDRMLHETTFDAFRLTHQKRKGRAAWRYSSSVGHS